MISFFVFAVVFFFFCVYEVVVNYRGVFLFFVCRINLFMRPLRAER